MGPSKRDTGARSRTDSSTFVPSNCSAVRLRSMQTMSPCIQLCPTAEAGLNNVNRTNTGLGADGKFDPCWFLPRSETPLLQPLCRAVCARTHRPGWPSREEKEIGRKVCQMESFRGAECPSESSTGLHEVVTPFPPNPANCSPEHHVDQPIVKPAGLTSCKSVPSKAGPSHFPAHTAKDK